MVNIMKSDVSRSFRFSSTILDIGEPVSVDAWGKRIAVADHNRVELFL